MPAFPWCFAFILFKCHLSPPPITSSCVFVKSTMTRYERTVVEARAFNLAKVEPQRATFTSKMVLILWKFALACGWRGGRDVWKTRGWTTGLTDERRKTQKINLTKALTYSFSSNSGFRFTSVHIELHAEITDSGESHFNFFVNLLIKQI